MSILVQREDRFIYYLLNVNLIQSFNSIREKQDETFSELHVSIMKSTQINDDGPFENSFLIVCNHNEDDSEFFFYTCIKSKNL